MSRSSHIPTTLPFYDSVEKRDEARTGYFEPRHCPRNQLLPFLIQRPHVADDWVNDIFLVNKDGNETNIADWFKDSIELITGGYTNGPGTLQAYDTMTIAADNIHLTSIIKTTTGAGDAGMETATAFAVTEGKRLYLEIDLTLNSGVAPKVVITEQGDETVVLSNEVLLVNGVNNIVFTITGTNASAALVFYNESADASNYSCSADPQTEILSFTRTNRPTVHEFTDVDYIQYNGEALNNSRSLIRTRSWTNNFYDTFTTLDTAITSAIELAATGQGWLPDAGAAGDMELIDAAEYTIYVPNVVINSGQAPQIRLVSSPWYITDFHTLAAGDNIIDVTLERTGGTGLTVYDGYLNVLNNEPANWSCGPVEVRKKSHGALPKGEFYLKITDGTNIWYSEWFCIQDIYTNLASEFETNSGYETLETDGMRIISAINTASNGFAWTDGFSVVTGEVITIIFFATLNSGAAPLILIDDPGGEGIVSNFVTVTEGINVVELTCTQAINDTAALRFSNTAAANFSTSEIWVKRQYDSRFVKLAFTNATDLRGKRSDDQTILYQNSFAQNLWLKTRLNTPETAPLEVGDEKDGLFIAEKVVSQQIYRIIDYINRSLFEALIRLPQHSTITITDEAGHEYTPNIGNIRVSIEWDTFDTGTVIIAFNDGSFVWTENADDIT